jgi:hypothetical protein
VLRAAIPLSEHSSAWESILLRGDASTSRRPVQRLEQPPLEAETPNPSLKADLHRTSTGVSLGPRDSPGLSFASRAQAPRRFRPAQLERSGARRGIQATVSSRVPVISSDVRNTARLAMKECLAESKPTKSVSMAFQG